MTDTLSNQYQTFTTRPLKRKTAVVVHVWPGLQQFGMSQVQQLLPDLHFGLDEGLSAWSSGTLWLQRGYVSSANLQPALSAGLHVLSVVNTLNMHKHWRAPGSLALSGNQGGGRLKKKQLQNIQCMMHSQKKTGTADRETLTFFHSGNNPRPPAAALYTTCIYKQHKGLTAVCKARLPVFVWLELNEIFPRFNSPIGWTYKPVFTSPLKSFHHQREKGTNERADKPSLSRSGGAASRLVSDILRLSPARPTQINMHERETTKSNMYECQNILNNKIYRICTLYQKKKTKQKRQKNFNRT